jgi:hypothetical protein
MGVPVRPLPVRRISPSVKAETIPSQSAARPEQWCGRRVFLGEARRLETAPKERVHLDT